MDNQIQLQLHHFCIINYNFNYNYVIGPGSGLQWWRFSINPGFYPPTLTKCFYLDNIIRKYIYLYIIEVHDMYWRYTDVLLLDIHVVPKLDTNSAVIIDTGEHSRKVMLEPTYPLRLCSPVPMITAEFVSSVDIQQIARSRTWVSFEYTWSLRHFPATYTAM